jgi:fluoride ion exporter CrcB/FEX
MAGAMLAWRFLMTDRLPLGTGGLLINVLGAVGIGSIAFVLASGIMASEELPILLRSFRRRRRGVRTEDES